MSDYKIEKIKNLREEALEVLRAMFAHKQQDCCGSPIGYVLFVIDCRVVLCSGSINKAVSIKAIEKWLASEHVGKNVIPTFNKDKRNAN